MHGWTWACRQTDEGRGEGMSVWQWDGDNEQGRRGGGHHGSLGWRVSSLWLAYHWWSGVGHRPPPAAAEVGGEGGRAGVGAEGPPPTRHQGGV